MKKKLIPFGAESNNWGPRQKRAAAIASLDVIEAVLASGAVFPDDFYTELIETRRTIFGFLSPDPVEA